MLADDDAVLNDSDFCTNAIGGERWIGDGCLNGDTVVNEIAVDDLLGLEYKSVYPAVE